MFLAKRLLKKRLLDSLIIETGEIARKKKIKRMFNVRFWMYPITAINLLGIFIYNKLATIYVKKKLGKVQLDITPQLKVKDVNEQACIDHIAQFKEPIVLIYGTAIVKKKFLSDTLCKIIININNGIVPFYRNVHSDFWAMYYKDYKKIGTTLMKLNQGIDAGNIISTGNIDYSERDNIFSVKLKNLILSGNMSIELIERITNTDKTPLGQVQNEIKSNSFSTPTFLELCRFFYSRKS